MIKTEVGARTDVGHVRRHNEDAYVARHPVFVVADGMGGHRAGDVASAVVAQRFGALVGQAPLQPASVLAALAAANERILELAGLDADLAGMGTTCVGLVLVGDLASPSWLAFNVGDSRLYVFAGSKLQPVSIDHSEVQEMIDAGLVSEAEARTYPRRNIVTRALGVDPPPQADVWELPAVAGQRWLLCSDGLTGEVPDDAIAEILAEVPHPEAAAERLVRQALDAGGRDNVTAIVVDVVEVEPGSAGDDTTPSGTTAGEATCDAPDWNGADAGPSEAGGR